MLLSAVNVFAVADLDNKNDENGIVDLIDDPVVSHPDAVFNIVTHELHAACWLWIQGQLVDCRADFLHLPGRNFAKVLLNPFGKFNPLGFHHGSGVVSLLPTERLLHDGVFRSPQRKKYLPEDPRIP